VSRLVKHAQWLMDKQKREWDGSFYTPIGEASCKPPARSVVLDDEDFNELITDRDIMLPMKRLR